MAKRIIGTFTIAIKGEPGAYTIEATGPKGIRVHPMPFIWSPSPEQEAIIASLAREKARVPPDALQKLGRALHDAVFTIPVAIQFGRAQGGPDSDSNVRLSLQVEALELASLPWEAMDDGQGILSARSDCPFVRTLLRQGGIQPSQQLRVYGALRILFVSASPQGLPVLDIGQAVTRLRQLLAETITNNCLVFDVLTGATLDELCSKLLQNYHVLYFAGHGTTEGIYLDDGMGGERDPRSGERPVGDPYLVSAQMLGQELEGKQTQLVFLSACNTGASFDESGKLLAGFAQELARRADLPAVVAMQYFISDLQANQLMARFSESLAAFYDVDVALAEARKSLIRQGVVSRDVIAPVIYLQAEDGALFQQAGEEGQQLQSAAGQQRDLAHWVFNSFLPALAFWGVSLLAYGYGTKWSFILAWENLHPLPQVLVLAGGVLVVSFTAYYLDLSRDALLNLMKGYGWDSTWVGRALRRLYATRIRRLLWLRDKLIHQLNTYDSRDIHLSEANVSELRFELMRVNQQLESLYPRFPAQTDIILPTALGNSLAAAEAYAYRLYGLEFNICWPRLYSLLPEATRAELQERRDKIDLTLRIGLLSLVFSIVWSAWSIWQSSIELLAIVSVAGWPIAALSYWGAVQSARRYADLIRVVFDQHRYQLYKSQNWPLPQSTHEESVAGRRLSEYLAGRQVEDPVHFEEL